MILLDSSFIMALYNERDEHHEDAAELMKVIAEKGFGDACISDYIFDETATGLLKNIGLAATIQRCNALLEASYLISVNERIFKKSFETFAKQKGTLLSFTDCTSVVIMEEREG